MTLIINNDDVAKVLTMETTLAALEESYLQLAAKTAVCRPRIDIRIPTGDPAKNYQWGTMEGGSTSGYFAIRMKSDSIYETQYNGVTTQEKYCMRPGLYCGLILLTSIHNGELLAFINDGHLQHMRVAGDGGIGDAARASGHGGLANSLDAIYGRTKDAHTAANAAATDHVARAASVTNIHNNAHAANTNTHAPTNVHAPTTVTIKIDGSKDPKSTAASVSEELNRSLRAAWASTSSSGAR